jgi:hypothetical protein
MSINHVLSPDIEPKFDIYAKSITADSIGVKGELYEYLPESTQLLVGDPAYYLTGGQRAPTYKLQFNKFSGNQDVVTLKTEGYWFTTAIPNGTPTKLAINTGLLQRLDNSLVAGIEEDSIILYSHLHMQMSEPIKTGNPGSPIQTAFLKSSLAKIPALYDPITKRVEFDISPLQIDDTLPPYNSFIHYSVELVYTLPPL